MLPAQFLDLRKPAAGQHQQADGHNGRAALGAGFEDFVENRAETPELLGTQEAFALLLLEALDVQAGVRSVRAQAPYLGHVEHLRENPHQEPLSRCRNSRSVGRHKAASAIQPLDYSPRPVPA